MKQHVSIGGWAALVVRKIVVDELPRMKPFMLGTDQDSQLEQVLGTEIVAYFLGKRSAPQGSAQGIG